MNHGSFMTLPNKDGTMLKFPREPRKPFSFKKKDNEMMQDYIDVGIGNYAILDLEQSENLKQEGDSFTRFWRMSFDGACSRSRNMLELYLKVLIKLYIHMLSNWSFYAQTMKQNMRH